MTYDDSENLWNGVDIDPEPKFERRAPDQEPSEIDKLRAEIAELRSQVGGRLDPAEEVAVAEQRRIAQDAAEREAKGAEAANDPATVQAVKAINSEAELLAYMRERGGYGGQIVG